MRVKGRTVSSGLVALQRVDAATRERSRELRRTMTPAERVLWRRVRNRGFMGCKFRRQQVIDGYFADFYCEEARLVVELDGPVHDKPARRAHDKHRDAVMAARGLTVLRIRNSEVLQNMDTALDKIKAALPARTSAARSPSPDEEGDRGRLPLPRSCSPWSLCNRKPTRQAARTTRSACPTR
jgi:very-short-patch-repair endonuclease